MSLAIDIRYARQSSRLAVSENQLVRLRRWLQQLGSLDSTTGPDQWLVSTGDRAGSHLHRVFDSEGINPETLAFLERRFNEETLVKSFALWNGQEDKARVATIESFFDRSDNTSDWLRLSLRSPVGASRLGTVSQATGALLSGVEIYTALYAGIAPPRYEAVFDDRPGVGWMIFLPRVLTPMQIPEASALIPVMGREDGHRQKQTGTLVVSVTDEPFSEANPDHIRIAHAIEIRLVDQNLLPRFDAM